MILSRQDIATCATKLKDTKRMSINLLNVALLTRDWSVCDLSNRSRFSLLCCWSSLCLNLASLSCCAGSWNDKLYVRECHRHAGTTNILPKFARRMQDGYKVKLYICHSEVYSALYNAVRVTRYRFNWQSIVVNSKNVIKVLKDSAGTFDFSSLHRRLTFRIAAIL